VALLVTLFVLLFAHDINRSAHQAINPRRSENRSFGQLANALINQENRFDSRLSYLLANGQTLTRPVFAARLSQLAAQLPLWMTGAEQLRRPTLAHDVNNLLAQLSEQRVDDYQSILATIAHSLTLPWTVASSSVPNATAAQVSLTQTAQQWNVARWSLAREPGRVALLSMTNDIARIDLSPALSALAASPGLLVTRGIGIAAVLVTPAPLPAPAGELVLPPASSVDLGVSVSNGSYVNQPVTLIVTLVPARGQGPSQRQTMSTTLGPLQSFGFDSQPFATKASEKATLTISVVGAPSAKNMTATRIYRVIMSPSGNA
jgi:hypothetical protein